MTSRLVSASLACWLYPAIRSAAVLARRPAPRRSWWERETWKSDEYAGFRVEKLLLFSLRLNGRSTFTLPPVRSGIVTPGSIVSCLDWAELSEEAVGASVMPYAVRSVKADSKRA